MGQPEIEDQVLAANYLRSLPFVDDDRIAMMGWSYGGFMSLMALTEPEMGLASAIVGAPPTEWSLYDTHYTERFMSTPQANAEGYAASDAIPRLPNLTGRMLLMHGMADDNVILENSTRVIDAMQAESHPVRTDALSRPAPRRAGQRKAAAAMADLSGLLRPDDRDEGARRAGTDRGEAGRRFRVPVRRIAVRTRRASPKPGSRSRRRERGGRDR